MLLTLTVYLEEQEQSDAEEVKAHRPSISAQSIVGWLYCPYQNSDRSINKVLRKCHIHVQLSRQASFLHCAEQLDQGPGLTFLPTRGLCLTRGPLASGASPSASILTWLALLRLFVTFGLVFALAPELPPALCCKP
jgi:hypothetical protein